jgi:hypothetical protein
MAIQLSKDIPIKFNSQVNLIEYNNNNNNNNSNGSNNNNNNNSSVKIHTNDEIIEADATLITVSLGVLKEG